VKNNGQRYADTSFYLIESDQMFQYAGGNYSAVSGTLCGFAVSTALSTTLEVMSDAAVKVPDARLMAAPPIGPKAHPDRESAKPKKMKVRVIARFDPRCGLEEILNVDIDLPLLLLCETHVWQVLYPFFVFLNKV